MVSLFQRRWQLEREDAEDLAQEFFVAALEKAWFERFDPGKGRFRSFLRVCADRFAGHHLEAQGRVKRGGRAVMIPIHGMAENVAAEDPAEDKWFRAEWVRSVFSQAFVALEEESGRQGRETHFAVFSAYDLIEYVDSPRPTYADLGHRFHLTNTQVLNHLAWARRRLRAHVLDIARRLAADEAQYREDVRDLFSIELGA